MSYLFDAVTEKLQATFTSNYDGDISIAFWMRKQDWDGGSEGLCMLSVDALDNSPSKGVTMSSTIDAVQCYERDSTSAGDWATEGVVADSANDAWWLIWATFADGGADRTIGETDSTQFDNSVISITEGTGYNDFVIGNQDTGSNGHASDNVCRIAELCFWNKILTNAEIDELRTGPGQGPAPNNTASANVVGYWTLANDANGLLNQGSDTGGDLSVTGATADNDHPIIIPTVTDVDTDETWNDGDSGLIITGDHFF